MSTSNTKRSRSKNQFYVLRKSGTPGIYSSYDQALRKKYPHIERPLIRGFKTWAEAEYYLRTGENMPIPRPVPKPVIYQRPLF